MFILENWVIEEKIKSSIVPTLKVVIVILGTMRNFSLMFLTSYLSFLWKLSRNELRWSVGLNLGPLMHIANSFLESWGLLTLLRQSESLQGAVSCVAGPSF